MTQSSISNNDCSEDAAQGENIVVAFVMLLVAVLLLSCSIPEPLPNDDGGGRRGAGHNDGDG